MARFYVYASALVEVFLLDATILIHRDSYIAQELF